MTFFRPHVGRPHFPLFDVHVHLGPSDTGEIYYPLLSGEDYLHLMHGTPLTQACAFPPLRNEGYRAANRDLLDWSRGTDGKILPFARLGGVQPISEPRPWMARRKLRGLLAPRPPDLDSLEDLRHYAGVKLLPHLDGVPAPEVFACIAELGLPVLIHGGKFSSPCWIERHILPQVKTPLIIAHLGAFPAELKLLRDAVELARRVERVYLDTSGAWIASFLNYAVEQVPDKLLFGSDAPLNHPLVAWFHVASIIQDDALLQRIGCEHAKAIFQ